MVMRKNNQSDQVGVCVWIGTNNVSLMASSEELRNFTFLLD